MHYFSGKGCFEFLESMHYCIGILSEMKGNSIRVYVNGKKLFTIDSGIDDSEFMEDIKRRRISVKSYWVNHHKKKHKKNRK
ncbi:Uncharacterised protein [uncultured Blautia sp.]